MTSNSRIPQHLAPYVEHIPKDSLVLLTGTLSNSANWLVVRYLCAVFSNDTAVRGRPASGIDDGPATAVKEDVGMVLVSWMRDFEFWRAEARRSGGIGLNSLAQNKRLVFVDGLGSSTPLAQPTSGPQQARKAQLPARIPSVSSSALPTRGDPPSTALRTRATAQPAAAILATPSKEPAHAHSLPTVDLGPVQAAIESALGSVASPTAILILDAPDILLALQDPSPNPSPSTALQSLVLALRLNPRVHATILSLASDTAALPSAPRSDHYVPTPLETESQALLIGLGHVADLVMSVRGLDTGAAGDVGGVVRVSAPGRDADEENGSVVHSKVWKEQELLYLCRTDGSAKVWERGAGVGVG